MHTFGIVGRDLWPEILNERRTAYLHYLIDSYLSISLKFQRKSILYAFLIYDQLKLVECGCLHLHIRIKLVYFAITLLGIHWYFCAVWFPLKSNNNCQTLRITRLRVHETIYVSIGKWQGRKSSQLGRWPIQWVSFSSSDRIMHFMRLCAFMLLYATATLGQQPSVWQCSNVAMWQCGDMAGCHVWQPFVSGGKLWRERAGRLVNSIHSGVA